MTTLRSVYEKGWCRNYAAKNKDGVMCLPDDGEAVAWCVIGGFHKVTYCDYGKVSRLMDIAEEYIRQHVAVPDDVVDKCIIIPWWNDRKETTKEDVMCMADYLDGTIRNLEEKGEFV